MALISMLLAANKNKNDLFGWLHDFFHSGTWLVIRNLGLFLIAVFWLATAYWVYKDARRRIEDPWLVAMATVVGVIPEPRISSSGRNAPEALLP